MKFILTLLIFLIILKYFVRNIMIFSKYKLDICNNEIFCNIKKINIELSENLYDQIMNSCKDAKYSNPLNRKGGTVPQNILMDKYPDVIEFFKSTSLKDIISNTIGKDVTNTPLIDPLSCTVIVYDRYGDYINWHYDNNVYNGRLITVNICIYHGNNRCSFFEYKDYNNKTITIKLKQFEAIVFEGTKVFHRVSPACDDEKRVILSMTFTTDKTIDTLNKMFSKIKRLYFY